MEIVGPQSNSYGTCCVKFQGKIIKTPFVLSYPKSLCFRKMQFEHLGVNSHSFSFFQTNETIKGINSLFEKNKNSIAS